MQHLTMNWLGNMEIGQTQLLVCQPTSRPVLFIRTKGIKRIIFLTYTVCFFMSGYKLAFNYLKAKRHVDAIDVCHKVRHLWMFTV